MVAKNGTDNNTVESVETVKDAKVPHQNTHPKLEVVDGDGVENPGLLKRAKNVITSKTFIAGISSAVVAAAATFVLSQRSNKMPMVEDEVATD
jgi:hypothetical protein